MINGFVRRYFLRCYAQELRSQAVKKEKYGSLSPWAEAVFQCMLMVGMLAFAAGGALYVWALKSRGALAEYLNGNFQLTALPIVLGSLLAIYVYVRALTVKYRGDPGAAVGFDSPRDRRIGNIQFGCVLMVALAAPAVVAVILD